MISTVFFDLYNYTNTVKLQRFDFQTTLSTENNINNYIRQIKIPNSLQYDFFDWKITRLEILYIYILNVILFIKY